MNELIEVDTLGRKSLFCPFRDFWRLIFIDRLRGPCKLTWVDRENRAFRGRISTQTNGILAI